MENWRRQRRENSGRSVQHRKPPRGNWQPSVPAWEKDFCRDVGTLDWGTILQMKQFMHLYTNVMDWDDSAGKEAFNNAKIRYWAQINGLPCDIPLPDCDLYIDKINWDSGVELEMLPDLDSIYMIPNRNKKHEPVVIFGDAFWKNHPVIPSGWGDIDQKADIANQPIIPAGWGDSDEKADIANQPIIPTGWGDSDEKADIANEPIIPTGWDDLDEKVDIANKQIIPTGWGDLDEKADIANEQIIPTGWGDIDEDIANQPIIPTSWGDIEEKEDTEKQPIIPTGWGDIEEKEEIANQPIIPTGWGDIEEKADITNQPIIPTSWGNIEETADIANQPIIPTGWVDDKEKAENANQSILTCWGDDVEKVDIFTKNPPANFSFGDSFAQITPTGWGDEEEKVAHSANVHSSNSGYPWDQNLGDITPTGWGDEEEKVECPASFGNPWDQDWRDITPTGWDMEEEKVEPPANMPPANFGNLWNQNWGYAYSNVAMPAWPGYYNNAWQFSGGGQPVGYMPWGRSWNDAWGQNYTSNVGPGQGEWDNINPPMANTGQFMSGHRPPRYQGRGHYRNQRSNRGRRHGGEQSGTGRRNAPWNWETVNSCGPVGSMTGGQSEKWKKHIS